VTPNKEYEYRVTAVNDEGPGEPSDASSGIFAKPEKGKIVYCLSFDEIKRLICFIHLEKPSFDLSGLLGGLGKKELRVKAGDPLTIDLPINGSPTPTITWTKDGEPVQPTRESVE
jgi:hypothetical protein